jgi:hypothetical protein
MLKDGFGGLFSAALFGLGGGAAAEIERAERDQAERRGDEAACEASRRGAEGSPHGNFIDEEPR